MKRSSSAPAFTPARPPPTSAGVEYALCDVAPVPAAQVAATYEAMEGANTHTTKRKPEIIDDGKAAPLTAAQIAALYDGVDDATKRSPAKSSNQEPSLEQTSQIQQTSVAWPQPSTVPPTVSTECRSSPATPRIEHGQSSPNNNQD